MLKLEINTIKQGTKHFMENPIYNLEYVFNGKLASQFIERFPKDIPAIMEILHQGSIKAKEVAAETLDEVKKAMKIDYFS